MTVVRDPKHFREAYVRTRAAAYDSLLAKLVVWAPDRGQALARMERALREFRVEGRGVATTIDFSRFILRHPAFRAGVHSTDFVDNLVAARADEPADEQSSRAS